MFLRFTVLDSDERSRLLRGVFIASYTLRDSAELTAYETDWLDEILDWFEENLKVPRCLDQPENHRALCWFRPEAGLPLRKIWELVSFLEARDVQVSVHRSTRPGKVIYSDSDQVVALPHRGRKRQLTARTAR